MIGYWLTQAFGNALPGRQVCCVISRTLVDHNDIAFNHPAKFVGPVYDEHEAKALAAQAPGGCLRGVEAVVDKDLTAGLRARELHADALLLLTDVDAVMDGYGTPHACPIRQATPASLRARNFPAGSMGPKVEAVCRFAEATGKPARRRPGAARRTGGNARRPVNSRDTTGCEAGHNGLAGSMIAGAACTTVCDRPMIRKPAAMTSKLEMAPAAPPGDSPFCRAGLAGRLWPFAVVAILAEASLALPPVSHDWAAVTVSLVLLLAVAVEFALPWQWMPAGLRVLVPLTYTGSVLALTLAGGPVSGIGVVVLIPLIWTALFHRRWESACVVVAIIAVEVTVSVVQSASDARPARQHRRVPAGNRAAAGAADRTQARGGQGPGGRRVAGQRRAAALRGRAGTEFGGVDDLGRRGPPPGRSQRRRPRRSDPPAAARGLRHAGAARLAFRVRRVTGALAFADSRLEWRRLLAELGGMFFLVLVAAGALLAAGLLRALFGTAGTLGATVPGHGISTRTALAIEVVLTFGLATVILGTASGRRDGRQTRL